MIGTMGKPGPPPRGGRRDRRRGVSCITSQLREMNG
jgi:hypothetical protein